MIDEIKQLAKERYCDNDYKYHILPVVKNALLLGRRLNADMNVIEAAAYLHDIGRAVSREQYQIENDHHIAGAKETRRILENLDIDDEFIGKVEHCVLVHRGRKEPAPQSIEAEIIACADAMAHFDTFLDLFAFFLVKNPVGKSVIESEKKMQRNWDKKLTLPEAKEIIKEKYDAVMLLLGSMKEYINNET
jgi:putative nucleotidyltransferase with HDIG domain